MYYLNVLMQFFNLNGLATSHPAPMISYTGVAGPERSGSTWLFNAIRLLLKSARIAYDPYWITNLSQSKLEHRECSILHGLHTVSKKLLKVDPHGSCDQAVAWRAWSA